MLRVGTQSNVCAARVDVDEAREALALLSEGDQRWKSTMQFRSAREIIFLFEYPGNGRRILNRRPCSGIDGHSTGTIFVPPSVLSRKRLFYVDSLARPRMPDRDGIGERIGFTGRETVAITPRGNERLASSWWYAKDARQAAKQTQPMHLPEPFPNAANRTAIADGYHDPIGK